MADMRITLILGADGAPFAHDLASRLEGSDELTVIVPTARDRWAMGLKSCPDLDALLAPPGSPSTHGVADELIGIGYSPAWQRPSDSVIADQIIRTDLLGAGFSLTEATAAAATRRTLGFRLLPMSDDRAELHVVVTEAGGPRAIHVAGYLADPAAHEATETVLVAESWSVSADVAAALADTDVMILGPSSRTLAIDPVLRTPGLLDLVADTLPVLVVDHDDTAPADLVRVAGLREADPGRAVPVPPDTHTVIARARELVGS